MISDDQKLWEKLVEHANAQKDGHLTIMKFTGNWRVGWYQPGEREGIQDLPEGETFAEAARTALRAEGISVSN